MQVSDLVNQYNNNLASGSEISTGTKGIEQLVSTVRQMQPGHMFEGTVNSIRGNQVILGLSSGQNITARIDKGITLEKGQSLFFQVKTNEGTQIQIKPVSNGNTNNPTLLQALDAANLPLTENHMNMVDSMMKEQMPIDAKSLMDMSRQAAMNPGVEVSTIVEMNKLSIPITQESAAMFQAYKDNQGIVMQEMDNVLLSIPDTLTDESVPMQDTLQLNKNVISVLDGTVLQAGVMDEGGIKGMVSGVNIDATMVQQDTVSTDSSVQSAILEEAAAQPAGVTAQGTVTEGTVGNLLQNSSQVTLAPQDTYPANTLGNVLPPEEFEALNEQVKTMFREQPQLLQNMVDANGNLLPETKVQDLLRQMANTLPQLESLTKDMTDALFSHKAYGKLLGNVMEQQWMLQPQEITSKEAVQQLYEKIGHEMQKLNDLAANMGKAGDNMSKASATLKNNVEFMNLVNQSYTYVQIPVRLTHQNVNSELYVYSNRKSTTSDNEEVTAFLHFDMEHLGSTDISVKLKNKDVDTKFYMENDGAYQLIENNIHILQAKLEAKGYHCTIQVDNESNSVNFVEDFLKKDMKSGGTVHRYSFDVRA